MASPPLSLVVDDCGIYYDASKPSALEKLVQDKAGNTALISQAREAMHTIVTGDMSKYNLAPAFVADESERTNIVLVVDQTFNDMSVTYGNAGPHEFAAMLEAAMAENPRRNLGEGAPRCTGRKENRLFRRSARHATSTFNCRECQPAVAVATRFPGLRRDLPIRL